MGSNPEKPNSVIGSKSDNLQTTKRFSFSISSNLKWVLRYF